MAPVTAHATQALDWQTWVTFGLGLLALAYLVRRWWPRRAQTAASCGTGNTTGSASGCSSCNGCGSGQGTLPMRDHRSSPSAAEPPAAPPMHRQAVQPVHWHPPRAH